MKRILCYGDSNTWGYSSENGRRLDKNLRFTGVLQSLLGEEYEVIEEGLRGRNIGHDFEYGAIGNLNGAKFFGQCLYTHNPLDFVVILLGTNDLDDIFNSTPAECAQILKQQYIDLINQKLVFVLSKKPKIIVVAPSVMKPQAARIKGKNAVEKSQSFNAEYEKVAYMNNCLFVSNAELEPGTDGLHLSEKSHKLLAERLCEIIKNN